MVMIQITQKKYVNQSVNKARTTSTAITYNAWLYSDYLHRLDTEYILPCTIQHMILLLNTN